MTWRITIDPVELMDTAVLLGTSAVELADIGSTLRTCTGCAMPPEVRTSVDNLVAVADRLFDDMALQLRAEATNVAQRAIIAANDMLTAAGYPPLPGTTTTPTPGTNVNGMGTTSISPGMSFNAGLIGGGQGMGTTSISPGISFNAGLIGGNNWGTITMSPGTSFNAGLIGGGTGTTSTSSGMSFGAGLIGGGMGFTPVSSAPSLLTGIIVSPHNRNDPLLNATARNDEKIKQLQAALKSASNSGATIASGSLPMPGVLSLSSLPAFSDPTLQMSEHIAIAKEEQRLGRKVPYLTPEAKKYYGITT